MRTLLTRLLHRRAGNRTRVSERGYSLLEVLIVLTIIALIAGLVGPRLIGLLESNKVKVACLQIKSFAGPLEFFNADLGRYPTNDEGLDLLVRPPTNDRDRAKWLRPYLAGEAEVPVDPWGNPYLYAAPREDFASPSIRSLGSDGAEGGEGLAADIENGCRP